MGRLIFNPCAIISYSVTTVQENPELQVIHLTIVSEDQTLKYRIWADEREPNLSSILAELNAGFSNARNGNSDIEVTEYTERDYLFVKYPNGISKQYSARKI